MNIPLTELFFFKTFLASYLQKLNKKISSTVICLGIIVNFEVDFKELS